MSQWRLNIGIARPNKGNGKKVKGGKDAFFLVMTALAFATPCFGDGSSASLTLGGTVSRVVSISVTPQNNYNSLNLVNGENNKTVAIVNERSNDKAGYTVTLTSLGAGSTGQAQFRPLTPGNPDTIPYSLEYNGAPVVLNQGSATLTTADGRTPDTGANDALAVTVPPSGNVTPDTYSDTLQLTIQGN